MNRQHEHQALRGRRVVVPESRELDRFSTMLERHGASVVRCPLVLVRALEDSVELDAWLGRLVHGQHDVLAFYTGEGVMHIMGRAEQLGLREEALAALARAQKVARGPKPGAALRSFGLSADIVAEFPTTAGLIATLHSLPLPGGRCVGVQLYPGAPSDLLSAALSARGAEFDPVLPYRYGAHEHDEQVAAVIHDMAAEHVDLIAFTSKLQVERLVEVAERKGLKADLARALQVTTIAAVGPVVAEAVVRAGGTVQIEPARNFHLKPLVSEIVRAMAPIT